MRRRARFAPLLGAVVVFLAIMALMAPASCRSVPQPPGEDGRPPPPLTACESLAGVPYGGNSLGDFLPAILFAGTAAVPTAWALRRLQARREGVTAAG